MKYITIQAWADIPEAEPNETDIEMLKAIQEDPECFEFVSEAEAMAELGLNV